jgi:hypothetical protein
MGFFWVAMVLFGAVFLGYSLKAQGQDNISVDDQRYLIELKKSYEGINSIKGTFRQEKNMPGLSAPLLSKGFFYYHRPGYLRWEYVWPLWSRLEISDGLISGWAGEAENPQKQPDGDLKAAKMAALQAMAWMSLDVEFIEKNSTIELTSKNPLRLRAFSKDLGSNREQPKVEVDFAPDGVTVDKICLSSSESSFCLYFSEVIFNSSE